MGGTQSQIPSRSNESVSVNFRDGWGIVDSGNPGDIPESKQPMSTKSQITENQKDQSSNYEDVADNNEMAKASKVEVKDSAEALCRWRGPLTHEEIIQIMLAKDFETLNEYIHGRTGGVINQFTPPWIISGRTEKTKNEEDTEMLLQQAKDAKDAVLEHLYSDISIFQEKMFPADSYDSQEVWRKWIHDKAAWEAAKKAEINLNKRLSLGIMETDKKSN